MEEAVYPGSIATYLICARDGFAGEPCFRSRTNPSFPWWKSPLKHRRPCSAPQASSRASHDSESRLDVAAERTLQGAAAARNEM